MGRQHIDEQAWSAADPDTVYEMLADGTTWPRWSGVGSFELRQPGDDAPEGLNSVRVFQTGRVTSVERIVELVPGRRLSYVLISGLPLRNYRADIDLIPSQGGTMIRWQSTFAAVRPGTGWLYRRGLGRFIRSATHGLAGYAASLVDGTAACDERLQHQPAGPGAAP